MQMTVFPMILGALSLLSASQSQSGIQCGLGVPVRCTCGEHTNHSINVFCDKINLTTVPVIDTGQHSVYSFSLEGNNLSSIQTGDFFGVKVSRLILKQNQISNLNLLAFWGLELHLDHLDIAYNLLTSIPSDALRLLLNLRTLNIEGNKITHIPAVAFPGLDRLEVLTLDYNPLISIHQDAFSGMNLLLLSMNAINFTNGLHDIPTKDLSKLRGLSIANNKLKVIPSDWFVHLTSLQSLTLDDNKLKNIQNDAFAGVAGTLKTLEINNNRLKKVPKHAFRTLEALESLELSHNRIRKLHSRSFNASKSLISLDLRYNRLHDISPIAFDGMNDAEIIDLRGNQLITLDEQTFFWENSRVRDVYLADNNWLCNCLLKWIKRDYKAHEGRADIFADLHLWKCKWPDFLVDMLLIRVPMHDLTCDHDYYYYYEYYEDDY